MRDAERVDERAGAEHRLGRAAGLGPVGLGVGPELQRHADDLGAALALQQRGDGAVDPARHRDEHATGGRRGQAPVRERRPAPAPGAGRRRPAGRRAAWPASGRRAPRRPRRSRSAPPRAPPRPSTISATAAVAARVAPQPSVSKLTRRDPSRPRRTSEIRERSPQAAPPAAPVKAPSGDRSRRRLVPQVLLEKLAGHAYRVEAPAARVSTYHCCIRSSMPRRMQRRCPDAPQIARNDLSVVPIWRQVTRITRQPSAAGSGRARDPPRMPSGPCAPRPSSSTISLCSAQRQSGFEVPTARPRGPH